MIWPKIGTYSGAYPKVSGTYLQQNFTYLQRKTNAVFVGAELLFFNLILNCRVFKPIDEDFF